MKPLSLRVYESIYPDDTIDQGDPGREPIMAEMRLMINPRISEENAARVALSWKHWLFDDLPDATKFIRYARRVAKALRGGK